MGDSNASEAATARRSGAADDAAPLPPPPVFLVTGFGPFCGVQSNPTQSLVQWLKTQQTLHSESVGAATAAAKPTAPGTYPPPQPRYSIKSLTVLEVSAAAVDAYMLEQSQHLLAEARAAEAAGSRPRPVVMLHLGVDTQRPALSLELQAYNNATFSCPDQRGWQPKAHLIEAAAGLGCSSVRTTTLPLQVRGCGRA